MCSTVKQHIVLVIYFFLMFSQNPLPYHLNPFIYALCTATWNIGLMACPLSEVSIASEKAKENRFCWELPRMGIHRSLLTICISCWEAG